MKITLVEDDRLTGLFVEAALTSLGHSVSSYSTIEQLPLGQDAYVLDALLPGGTDGITLARELKEREPEAIIVFISGSRDTHNQMQFLELTFPWRVILKPFNPEELPGLLKIALKEAT